MTSRVVISVHKSATRENGPVEEEELNLKEELELIGGAEGDRTPDLRIANAALCQTELLPHKWAS
jgi:hypothetical protein